MWLNKQIFILMMPRTRQWRRHTHNIRTCNLTRSLRAAKPCLMATAGIPAWMAMETMCPLTWESHSRHVSMFLRKNVRTDCKDKSITLVNITKVCLSITTNTIYSWVYYYLNTPWIWPLVYSFQSAALATMTSGVQLQSLLPTGSHSLTTNWKTYESWIKSFEQTKGKLGRTLAMV